MGLRRKRAAKNASAAARHTAKAVSDLGSAASRMASAGTTLAGVKAKKATKAVADSETAKQARERAHGAGEAGKATVQRWRKRGRRLFTAALLAGVAVIAQQVRSQPVPPGVEDG